MSSVGVNLYLGELRSYLMDPLDTIWTKIFTDTELALIDNTLSPVAVPTARGDLKGMGHAFCVHSVLGFHPTDTNYLVLRRACMLMREPVPILMDVMSDDPEELQWAVFKFMMCRPPHKRGEWWESTQRALRIRGAVTQKAPLLAELERI